MKVPILIGPTASGKTALALTIARRKGVVIVNADSKQVYKELPVITAQPGAEELRAAPHTLYGRVSVTTAYDVAQWVQDAAKAIDDAARSGKTPLLVGGTGMYIDALMHGLSPAPRTPEHITDELRREAERRGSSYIHAVLQECDPESAARIAPADAPRLIRAYGAYLASGTSLTEWNAKPRIKYMPPETQFIILALERDRETLYKRAETRFDAMLRAGALDEARRYAQITAAHPSSKAHGLPELLAFLRGETDLDAATTLAKRNTRRYIKRQFTWMRHQLPERISLTSFNDDECADIFLREIHKTTT